MLSTIENFYERLVAERIRERLKDTDEAADLDYVDDLACVALNSLPPRYVRHSIDLMSRLGDEEADTLRRDAAEAVDRAIATIARRQAAR